MELFGSLLLFVLFIVIYNIIAEVFIVLFRFTGIPEEKARFQVISMLTNSGYTTRESEMFVKSKMRRKLASMTMMFGYAFTVTIVSSTVNVFIQIKDISELSSISFIPVIFIVALGYWMIRKNRFLGKMFNERIEKIARKFMFKSDENPLLIIDEYDDLIIAEVVFRKIPEIFVGKDIMSSGLKSDHDINGLLVRRMGHHEELINADTIIKQGDSMVVLGKETVIRKVLGAQSKADKLNKTK